MFIVSLDVVVLSVFHPTTTNPCVTLGYLSRLIYDHLRANAGSLIGVFSMNDLGARRC